MVNESDIKILFRSFPEEITKIFQNHLIFGFLCGSIVKQNIHENSDIDVFVCVSKINHREIVKFHKWYFSFHNRYHLKGDRKYPGEVVTITQLEKAFKKMDKTVPQFIITNRAIYDGIVWAGMLSGKYKGFIGERKIFMKYRKMGLKIGLKWIKYLIKRISRQAPDEIAKKLISYKPSK